VRFWVSAEAVDAFIPQGARLLAELYPFFCLKEYVTLVRERLLDWYRSIQKCS
jgi:hypothetical protein